MRFMCYNVLWMDGDSDMRMTSQRKAILAYLEKTRQPQSVEMIHVGLSNCHELADGLPDA